MLILSNLVVGVDYAFRDNILFLAEYQTADFEQSAYKNYSRRWRRITAGVYYTF